MRPIHASEIGVYAYCKRAWWFHSQGEEPDNELELAAGAAFHRVHGKQILVAGLLQLGGWFLLLLAVILLGAGLALGFLQ
ncbi:MAG TPA: hypothetical protein VLH85_09605 [Levilinea sp.]|nr:hypothetical protein [Levilinea sp.]